MKAASRLVDEMYLAISPVLLDRGESLFAGIDLLKLGYHCAEQVTSPPHCMWC